MKILTFFVTFNILLGGAPKTFLQDFFNELNRTVQTLNEQQLFDSMTVIAEKLDSSDIPYLLKKGKDEPILAFPCLIFLSGAVQKGAGTYGESVVEYAIREYIRDTTFYEFSRFVLMGVGEPSVGIVSERVLKNKNLRPGTRKGIAQMWISSGGVESIIFVLNDEGLKSDAAYLLRSAGSFNILAAANQWKGESELLDSLVNEAKLKLKQQKPLPFNIKKDPTLSSDQCAVKIINEAPVTLALTLIDESLNQEFNFIFPSGTTRSYKLHFGKYYFKAASPNPFIRPTEGFEDFEPNCVFEWIFFLEDQLEEMKAKYPGYKELN